MLLAELRQRGPHVAGGRHERTWVKVAGKASSKRSNAGREAGRSADLGTSPGADHGHEGHGPYLAGGSEGQERRGVRG